MQGRGGPLYLVPRFCELWFRTKGVATYGIKGGSVSCTALANEHINRVNRLFTCSHGVCSVKFRREA